MAAMMSKFSNAPSGNVMWIVPSVAVPPLIQAPLSDLVLHCSTARQVVNTLALE